MIISLDTNLLFFAFAEDRPEHPAALSFVEALNPREDVLLNEFVLAELYRLIRNPVVLEKPLSATEAAETIQQWRRHPRWRITGFSPDSQRLHDELWKAAASPGFAYRRLYDARMAFALRHFGVTDFATVNTKDFQGFGFSRVWNPLTAGA